MKEVKNTIIMTMEPQEPFLNWVAELMDKLKKDPSLQEQSLPNHEQIIARLLTQTVILIPNMDLSEKLNEYMRAHSEELLANEFSKWTQDDTLWPARCDIEILQDLFKLRFYDNIVDIRDLK